MANVSRVKGFRALRYSSGAPYNGSGIPMLFANDSTAVFIGDVVNYGGTAGAAGLVISGMDVEGMPTVIQSTNTTTLDGIAGVVVGILQDTTLPSKYAVASGGNRIVLVEPLGSEVVYEVQEDGVGNNIAATAIGANIGFNSGAGSTVTGMSAYSLDSSVTATTVTYPLRLLGLVKRPDNALGLSTTDLGKFEVVFNTDYQVGTLTMAITTGSFGRALWPGINAWYGKGYDEYHDGVRQDFHHA